MATAIRSPRGVYVFRPATGVIDLSTPAATNPHVAGWVLRDRWASVQPTAGTPPDFSRLLAAARTVAAQGKQWQLEVFAGVQTPKWAGGVNVQLAPVNVAKYVELVRQMGRTFASDKSLVAVHCCLPMNTSPEFRLTGTTIGQPGWQKVALDANSRALTALAAAFPGIAIVVDLHNPDSAADGFVVSQIEQGTRLLGKQFAVQVNAWNAKPGQKTYNVYNAVQAHASAGYVAGLEQVQVSTDPAYGGTFEQSKQYIGRAAYLIVYDPDDRRVKGPLV